MHTVLVVEDDKYLSNAYRVKLARAGFNVVIVGNGEEAISYLKTYIPTLIILDLVMPQVDGFTVLQEIKQIESLKKIPVIVASNLGQPEDIDKAKKMGAYDYIVKSELTMNQLVEKIMDTIKRFGVSPEISGESKPL